MQSRFKVKDNICNSDPLRILDTTVTVRREELVFNTHIT